MHSSSFFITTATLTDCVAFVSSTEAIDATNIRLFFAAVKETIPQNALKDSGSYQWRN
jgi:hypothetical protein